LYGSVHVVASVLNVIAVPSAAYEILITWHSGRTLTFDEQTFPVLHSTCSCDHSCL